MPGTSGPARRRHALILAGTLALTAAVYAPVWRAGFLAFDDPENVVQNPSIQQWNWANLRHIWTTPLQFMYTPLVSLSYAVDYRLGRLDPVVYHATNLALHLVNVVLVYLLCRVVTRRAFLAHAVAVGFAVHPVNVDTVAWISTRSTLLSTAFGLGSLLAYLRYDRRTRATRGDRRGGRWAYPLALGLFVLAVLAKSTAVSLVAVLPLLDYCRHRRWGWGVAAEKLPFAAVAIAAGLATVHFRADTASPYPYSLLDRAFLVCGALVAYLARFVVPYPVAFVYAYPVKSGAFLPWRCYLAPVVLAIVILLLCRTGVPRRLLLFGLAFFALGVVLSQTVSLEDNYAANRYAYLPYVGLLLIGAELARRSRTWLAAPGRTAWRRAAPRVTGRLAAASLVAGSLLVVSWSAASFARSTLWTDPVRVLDDSLRHQPRVPFLYTVRGTTEYQAGDYPAARRDFQRTIAMDPTSALGHYYLGLTAHAEGQDAAAVDEYDRAIALAPSLAAAYDGRGAAELALGRYDAALADLSRAIAMDGYLVDAYLNRGRVYAALHGYPQAIADFDAAIVRDPGYGETYAERADAEQRLGELDAACADRRAARSRGFAGAGAAAPDSCAPG